MQLLSEMDGFDERGDVRSSRRRTASTCSIGDPPPRAVRPPHRGRRNRASRAARRSSRSTPEGMNLAEAVDYVTLAARPRASPARNSRSLTTEAGMFAIRDGRDEVEMADFEAAYEKIVESSDEGIPPYASYVRKTTGTTARPFSRFPRRRFLRVSRVPRCSRRIEAPYAARPEATPMSTIRVVRGTGTGPTEMSAYDAALADANVHNYNLVAGLVGHPGGVESKARQPRRPRAGGEPPDGRGGAATRRWVAGPRVSAGLGWTTGREGGPGLFYEARAHRPGGRAERVARASARAGTCATGPPSAGAWRRRAPGARLGPGRTRPPSWSRVTARATPSCRSAGVG